jgi:hypothetical protein
MEKSDQLRELFQMQTALDEHLGGKKNEAGFEREDGESAKKQADDKKPI